MVSHNNDGIFYEIAIDSAKEGAEVWDLNPYFKARVGDSNAALGVRWYNQGLLAAFDGKQTPIISGNVGSYSIDAKTKELIMAPDAAIVNYTGTPNDMLPGGRAKYVFPEQMFPKEGAFKGFIGYVDESDGKRRVSGVTVWFKVLPGVAQMGRACDFYINDLDAALVNAKEKMRQQSADFNATLQVALQDLRAKYQQEAQANQDAATSTRKELLKLADAVGMVQAQIDAGNVVTRKDFEARTNALSNEIATRLSQLQNGVQAYDNAAAIQSAHPQGADGIFVAIDTGHQWYWSNGAWQDGGAYQATGLDSATLDLIQRAIKVAPQVVDGSTYDRVLPDADQVVDPATYLLNFPAKSSAIPLNLPFGAFPEAPVLLINAGNNRAQVAIGIDGINARFYDLVNHKYLPWYSVSNSLAANTTLTNTTLFGSAGDLPNGKLYSVKGGVLADSPTQQDYRIMTLASRLYSNDGRLQLAYDNEGAVYYRTTTSDSTKWTAWSTTATTDVTDALRGDAIEQLKLQNKVWQRHNSLNVEMDKWIDGQGTVQPYKGWCYTPYYVPVTPHTDYVFAARDVGANITYNIMPMPSVFVALYDSTKRYLGSVQTTNQSRGSFNTGAAAYIRFSMSARSVTDGQLPSLFVGKDLPDDITAEIGPRYPQTDAAILANATAKFGMVPSVMIPKMDSLPLYLYRDTLVTGDVAGETMVYLTNNQSGDITPNATESGWVVPKKRLASGVVPFVATKGHSTSSYWVMPADNLQREATVYVKGLAETDGSGKAIRVLVIGDSLTNYNTYVNRAGELAGADTHTHITFLGTRGDVTKHEGRGGWAAKTYTSKAQFNTYDNPFLSDNKFNFGNYMAAQGYDGVDLVIINLGTNDVSYNDINADPDFATDFAAYTEMITSIKAYNPKVTIALGSTITPARYGNSHLDIKTRRQDWNAHLQKYCQQNGYTYIPYALVVDPINDFKYDDVPIDEYNQTIIKKVADSTHPAESGYKKMGDLTYATIKMIAAGMQVTM